ncbi:hypothetical protein HID58_035543 [Brassica napus]|uniref:Response regulatory domain-containing protein n=1 Tax=Brassica napus TaxID=3708 RepID=A0ABQ8C575_BRANA|nr:hypothetical protein HID58_035543 [Brassica napus]
MEEELHVLAVDDNLMDRKLVERILKISSCKGKLYYSNFQFFIFLLNPKNQDSSMLWYYVTTAENGIRALEYLGLGDSQQADSSSTNNESSNLKEVPVVILSSENIPTRINKCLASGAQMFMQKPLKLSDVEKLKCHLLNCRS